MIFDKFSRCYQEGIDIGFVQIDKIDSNGKKYYKKCPGEEFSPGKLVKRCMSCPYLDNKLLRKREKIIEEMEFRKRLKDRGIDV